MPSDAPQPSECDSGIYPAAPSVRPPSAPGGGDHDAQRISEKRFRLLARATVDAIYDWDIGRDEVWWGEGLSAFGFAPRDVAGSIAAWTALVHPQDRDMVLETLQAALAGGGEIWSAEYRFLHPDGTVVHCADRGSIERDEAGRAVRMVGGVTDISRRKRAEAKLREQATLLDGAKDAILVRDLEHRISYWNRGAERLYGWSAREVQGGSVQELLYRDPQAFLAATEVTLSRGEWVGEMEQLTRDERKVVVEGRWTLLRDEEGRPSSILAINTDVTEKKKLESQFLRAQRLESIGALAGGIAHDLNNVFAPILMTTSLLRQDEGDPVRRKDLETIEGCAQRGADMVRQLLSFARGAEGRRVKTSLGRVAREIEGLVRDTFPRDIRFSLSVEPDLWEVLADPTQMHQLLTNLCVNARDAMADGGSLIVSVENVILDDLFAGMEGAARPGPYVLLQVVDTGTGMTADVRERIFEPFFTTKEAGRGTGLGLPTSLSIAKSHGGFLRVTSELGHGSCFSAYLPAASPRERVDSFVAELGSTERGNGELILLVDDEEDIQRAARRVLESAGYRVLVASNGAVALARYAEYRPRVALVITDMMMPVLDGAAAVAALRAIDPQVKVVGSSGLRDHMPRAIEEGLAALLPKPYTAETLLRTVRIALAPTR